jgi:hypothetical protein
MYLSAFIYPQQGLAICFSDRVVISRTDVEVHDSKFNGLRSRSFNSIRCVQHSLLVDIAIVVII